MDGGPENRRRAAEQNNKARNGVAPEEPASALEKTVPGTNFFDKNLSTKTVPGTVSGIAGGLPFLTQVFFGNSKLLNVKLLPIPGAAFSNYTESAMLSL
ncbi:MAG: hypothetical protein LBB98_06910 [Treponema sp.]|jgi:hypothetical protein|nr:hypothetical protein [Treponema sp.]